MNRDKRKRALPSNRSSGFEADNDDDLGDESLDTDLDLMGMLHEVDVNNPDGGALEIYKILSRILGKELPKNYTPRINKLETLICELGGKNMLISRSDIKYTSDPGKVLTYLTRTGDFYRLKRGIYLYRPIKISTVLTDYHWPPLTRCVFALETALLLHYGSPRVPKHIDIAVNHTRRVSLDYSEVTIRRYTKPNVFSHGVESMEVAGQVIQLYSKERTIADLFRFRNEDPVRKERALNALVAWWKQGGISLAMLEEAARVCHVWKFLQPCAEMLKYIEKNDGIKKKSSLSNPPD